MPRAARAGRAGGQAVAWGAACLAVGLLTRRVLAVVAALDAPAPACPEGHLLCQTQRLRATPLHCVAPAFVCDGYNDCQNGLDETNCQGRCQDGAEECDGRCILAAYWCDGQQDCMDGADEVACRGLAPDSRDLVECVPRSAALGRPAGPTTAAVMRRGSLWCDGRNDCKFGKDERSCKKASLCRGGATHCTSTNSGLPRCVHASALCDGYQDCEDGSDERDCAEGGPGASSTSTAVPTTPPGRRRPTARRPTVPPPERHAAAPAPTADAPSSITAGPTTPAMAVLQPAAAQSPASSPGSLLVVHNGLPVYVWIMILALGKILLGLTWFGVRRWCSGPEEDDGRQGMEKAASFVFVGSNSEQVANSLPGLQPLVQVQEGAAVDLLTPCAAPAAAPAALATQPPPRPPPLRPQRSLSGESIYETLREVTRPGVDLLMSTLEDVVYATPSLRA